MRMGCSLPQSTHWTKTSYAGISSLLSPQRSNSKPTMLFNARSVGAEVFEIPLSIPLMSTVDERSNCNKNNTLSNRECVCYSFSVDLILHLCSRCRFGGVQIR